MASVTFEAAGTAGASTGRNSVSNTHVSSGGSTTVVLAFVCHVKVSSGITSWPTCTYGGVSMTRLFTASTGSTYANFYGITGFALFNPPAGSQTCTATASNTPNSLALATVSYTNVGDIGAVSSQASVTSGTAHSIDVLSASTDERIVFVHGMGALGGSGNSFTTHNTTPRINASAGSGSNQCATYVADTAGTGSSITGTATTSGSVSTTQVRNIGIRLKPAKTSTAELVGTEAVAGTSLTIPAGHQAGDLIVMAAWRANATAASKPAGWTDFSPTTTIASGAGSLRIAYKVAASSSETSGTWTNAAQVMCAVYRGATTGASAMLGTGSLAQINYPSCTFANTNDLSRVLRFAGRVAGAGNFLPLLTSSVGDPNVGWPIIDGVDTASTVLDSRGTVLESPATMVNQIANGTGVGCAATIEIVGTDVAPPEGQSSGSYSWTSAATGKRTPKASGAGNYTWTGTSTGKSSRRATSSGTYSWGSTAVGARTPKGAASGAYQWETGSVGEANYEGQASGAYAWTGAAVGQTPVDVPTGSGSYGWASSAVGYSHRIAAVDAIYGWAATVVGKREPKGNAGTNDYEFVGTATGKRVPKASAAGAYAFDLDEAVGFRTGAAFASGGYKWVALATGLFVPKPVAGVVGWYAE